MRLSLRPLVLLLALAGPLGAAQPRAVVRGPSKGTVGERLLVYVDQSVSDDRLEVQCVGPGSVDLFDKEGKAALAVVIPTEPGDLFLAVVASGVPDGETKPKNNFAFWKIAVSPAPPTPGPGPAPVPPGPAPPIPVPTPGLRVGIVYETGDVSKLPPGQVAALYSKSLRDTLNARCAVGPDGKTREWRIYDADVDLTGEADTWKAIMGRPRKSLPWIVISNGAAGYEGPLPATTDEAVALVNRYAGGG